MSADERTARVERAVQEHASALLGYFVRRVAEREDAADLLAETLLVLWRKSRALPAVDAEIRPWMFGIARNVLMHHQRSGVRRHAVVEKLRGILEVTPHPGFADPTEHDDLHRALAELEPLDRDIIGLLHWEGFALVEVARMLRMKEGTVRSRYHRARERLRAALVPVDAPAFDRR